jgi:hypothetical protein
MAKAAVYLLVSILIFLIYSCKETSITEINNKIEIDKVDSLYSHITFNFVNDVVVIPTGGKSPDWNGLIPSTWGKSFIPVNNGYLQDIEITNYKSEKAYFTINPLKNFPIKLKNGILDKNNQLFIQLDTKFLTPGKYEDLVYFNNTKHLGFKISVNVK